VPYLPREPRNEAGDGAWISIAEFLVDNGCRHMGLCLTFVRALTPVHGVYGARPARLLTPEPPSAKLQGVNYY